MESLARASQQPRALARIRSADLANVCVAAAASVVALTFAALALIRYNTFNATAFDLGFFDQVVWQISQGRPGLTSYLFWYDFFGQHLEPVLYLYGGLYRLWADPRLLLVSQALAVGAAAWLLYRCARHVVAPWPAAGIASAFLLSVPLHNALAFDFHPEVMSCLPLFAGLWLAFKRRPWTAVAAWATLLLLKEDEALVLPALGLLLFLVSRRRLPSAVLVLLGLLWAGVAVGLIEPHWRHGFAGDLTRDYAAFGGSLAAAVATVLLHPLPAVRLMFGSGGSAALWRWIGGMGWVPLLAPLGFVAALPELLLQLASSNPAQHTLQLHYGVEAVPLLYAFLVVELGWLAQIPRLGRGLVTAVPLLAALAFVAWSPFRLGPPTASPSAAHLQAVAAALRLIPPEAALRADSTLAAHLSRRQQVYEFPGPDWGSYVALDATAFHPAQAWNHGYRGAVASLPSEGYRKIYEREGVQVWSR